MFINNKIEVKRLLTTWNFEVYSTILSNIDCLLQNIDEWSLGANLDSQNQNFLITIIWNNWLQLSKDLFKINDIIFDKNWDKYTIGFIKFFEWPVVNTVELYCNYKKNW